MDALQEAKVLSANSHFSAAIVFSTTSIELLLKATLLKPVVHGLIHNEAIATSIVNYSLQRVSFSRYKNLLSKIYEEFAKVDLEKIYRADGNRPLLEEIATVKRLRNDILHDGVKGTAEQAQFAFSIATGVYIAIVGPMYP